MGAFITGNTALPVFVNANPPQGLPGEVDAADMAAIWAALGDVRSGLLGPDQVYKLAALGAVARSLPAKLSDLISLNDFGIGDPSAVLNVLENGRVSQLPYVEPFAWFRLDQFTGAWGVASVPGEKQEALSILRSTVGAVVVGGVETIAAASQLRFQDNPQGLLVEPGRTQLISTPDAPVSQTGIAISSTGAQAYYLRVEGSGSIDVALATGTATGLPGTATATSPLRWIQTATGTVNTTVNGSLTFAQLEKDSGSAAGAMLPTSRIHTASTRNPDAVFAAGLLRNARNWIVAIRAQPSGGFDWGPGSSDRGLFTIGDALGANSAAAWVGGADGYLRFQITDTAGLIKQFATGYVYLGNIEHEFWFHGSIDGDMEAWIDGQIVAPTFSGTGTGIITTMPANLRFGSSILAQLNGVIKGARLYYDTTPDRLPKPQWTRIQVATSVACIGDSITFGTGTTVPYPTTLQANLSGGTTGTWTVLNAGIGGDQTWQTLRRWGAGVRRQTQKYVVLLSGTNDVANSIPAQTAWNNLIRIANQVRSDGKTLVLVTILPRTPLTTITDGERKKLNVLIRAYCAAGNAILADADPQFDNGDGRTLKPIYDSGDGIHPNLAGSTLLASIVAGVIPH